MSVSAPKPGRESSSTPVDPDAIPRAFVTHRARRAARDDHELEVRRSTVRFWVLLAILVFVGFLLAFSIWDQIQSLFGLGT